MKAEENEITFHCFIFFLFPKKKKTNSKIYMCHLWWCYSWFKLFTFWSGRQITGWRLLMMIKWNRKDIEQIIDISHRSIVRHLKTLWHVNCYDVCVPCDLTETNVMACIFICNSLLKHKRKPLKRMTTSKEKWIIYNNAG